MQSKCAVSVVLVSFFFLNLSIVFAGDPTWRVFGELKAGRHHHSARYIGKDKILVMGGYLKSTGILQGDLTNTTEIIDVNTGVVTEGPSMSGTRAEFVCLTERDGSLIVIGGYGSASRNVDRFDIKTGSWVPLGQMIFDRRQHSAAFITPDEILIVAGFGTSSAEIFNINTGKSRRVADYPDVANSLRALEFTTREPGFYGGRSGGPGSPRSRYSTKFDVASNKWSNDINLFIGVAAPEFIALNDGTCIVVGGGTEDQTTFTTSTAVSIAQPNGIGRVIGNLKVGRQHHDIAEYTNGRILCTGGISDNVAYEARCEWIDKISGVVTDGPQMNFEHAFSELVVVATPSGGKKAIVISGLTSTGQTPMLEILESDCQNSDTEISLSEQGIYLAGKAEFYGNGVRLTDTSSYAAGAAWVKGKVFVTSGFDTRFSFRMVKGSDGAQPDLGPVGADGIAFVLQSQYQSILGLPGRGIGYENIVNGLAVEFDAYLNAEYSDVATSHIALQQGDGRFIKPIHSEPYVLGVATTGFPEFRSDGTVYFGRIQLVGSSLRVYCDTTGELNMPVLSVTGVDLHSILGQPKDGASYMGITSATGIAVQQHELLSWEIEGCDAILTSLDEEIPSEQTPYKIYPSPTDETSLLKIDGSSSNETQVAVYSTDGLKVFEEIVPAFTDQITLDARNLSSGIYLVVCQSNGNTQTVKWVVSH